MPLYVIVRLASLPSDQAASAAEPGAAVGHREPRDRCRCTNRHQGQECGGRSKGNTYSGTYDCTCERLCQCSPQWNAAHCDPHSHRGQACANQPERRRIPDVFSCVSRRCPCNDLTQGRYCETDQRTSDRAADDEAPGYGVTCTLGRIVVPVIAHSHNSFFPRWTSPDNGHGGSSRTTQNAFVPSVVLALPLVIWSHPAIPAPRIRADHRA